MICEEKKCTGCYACYNICPRNAINMTEDIYGNIFPKIDEKKCIKCNLCKKVCPQLKKNNAEIPQKIYAMYSKNKEIRKEAASGGIATTLYKHILNQKGVGYGVNNYFLNEKITFSRIETEEDIKKVIGSKYVHAYIEDTFKKIKKDLNDDKRVVFIGTPCQVAGLKSYLNNINSEKLITVDIICHGVPSQKLLKEDFSYNGVGVEKIKKIKFRTINGFELVLFGKKNEKILSKKYSDDYYFINFLRGNIYRECCYNCKYATKARVSDITIGDFWGLNKNSKIYDDESKGISLVMINTQKGKDIINEIKEYTDFEERDIEEALNGNKQLRKPSIMTKQFLIYRKKYPLIGFEKTMKKMQSFRDVIRKNKVIYRLYKIYTKIMKKK